MTKPNVADAYRWRVTYADGSIVNEESALGWRAVDADRVRLIELVADGLPTVTVTVNSQEYPRVFRRRVVTSTGGSETIAICVEREIGRYATYLFIDGDGNVLQTEDLDAI